MDGRVSAAPLAPLLGPSAAPALVPSVTPSPPVSGTLIVGSRGLEACDFPSRFQIVHARGPRQAASGRARGSYREEAVIAATFAHRRTGSNRRSHLRSGESITAGLVRRSCAHVVEVGFVRPRCGGQVGEFPTRTGRYRRRCSPRRCRTSEERPKARIADCDPMSSRTRWASELLRSRASNRLYYLGRRQHTTRADYVIVGSPAPCNWEDSLFQQYTHKSTKAAAYVILGWPGAWYLWLARWPAGTIGHSAGQRKYCGGLTQVPGLRDVL
jgi:hypothetical protein